MRNIWRVLLWQWHHWDVALSHLLAVGRSTAQPGRPRSRLSRIAAQIGAHLGDSWVWALATALLWRWQRQARSSRLHEDQPHRMRPVWGWALSLVSGAALTSLVKRHIRRPRPLESWLLHGRGADRYSFPSGHAVRWGIIAAWSSRFVPNGTMLAWTLALWTGWSRVHLGIHYVGDVLAGYAVGALVGWLVRRVLGERGKI